MTAAVLPLPAQAYVYVIGADDGPQKIGVANDPKGRLSIFQVGNPTTLVISAAEPVTREQAFAVEHYAHQLLKERRVRGEWFDVSPIEAIDAVRLAIDAVVNGNTIEVAGQPATRTQIRMARAALGWGVRELGNATGLAPGTITRIENGKEAMGGSLRKIEQALQEAGIDFPDPYTVSYRRAVDRADE